MTKEEAQALAPGTTVYIVMDLRRLGIWGIKEAIFTSIKDNVCLIQVEDFKTDGTYWESTSRPARARPENLELTKEKAKESAISYLNHDLSSYLFLIEHCKKILEEFKKLNPNDIPVSVEWKMGNSGFVCEKIV